MKSQNPPQTLSDLEAAANQFKRISWQNRKEFLDATRAIPHNDLAFSICQYFGAEVARLERRQKSFVFQLFFLWLTSVALVVSLYLGLRGNG